MKRGINNNNNHHFAALKFNRINVIIALKAQPSSIGDQRKCDIARHQQAIERDGTSLHLRAMLRVTQIQR